MFINYFYNSGLKRMLKDIDENILRKTKEAKSTSL
jgi:hypothetical protein